MCWRAFHSFGGRDPVASVVLAVRDVQLLAERMDCPHVAWAFDRPPYLRKKAFPGYKGTRDVIEASDEKAQTRNQIRLLAEEYLPSLRYANVLMEKGYEADDLMAAAVRSHPDPDDRFILVTGDHDLYQLMNLRTAVFHPVKGRLITAVGYKGETGVHPRHHPKIKAIAGCTSDAIPGVVGVAEPTATRYVAGTLTAGKKFEAIEEFVRTPDYQRNLDLVTLPYAGCPAQTVKPDDPQDWSVLAKRLGAGYLVDAHTPAAAFRRG